MLTVAALCCICSLLCVSNSDWATENKAGRSVSVNGNEEPRWRDLPPIQFKCNCSYSLLIYNKTPVHSTWGLLRVCAACPTPRLNLSSEFRPSGNNIKDTFLTGSAQDTTYLLTNLLTPWCSVLLVKLTVLQLVKKFPAFHGTRRFITALTSVRHLSLSWASPIQSISSWRSILILSTHLRLGLPSGLLPSGFPSKTLYIPLSSLIRSTCPAQQQLNEIMEPYVYYSTDNLGGQWIYERIRSYKDGFRTVKTTNSTVWGIMVNWSHRCVGCGK